MSFTPPFLPRIGSYEYPAPGTVQIRSMTDLPLSGQQFALLSSKFELHKIALRSSLADYVVANGELADGTRYRIISNGPQHIISAWPVPGGGTVFIPRIYSGIVRDGQIVDVDGKHMLRDFQPTAQCWQYPLAKSTAVPTGAFSDIKALAVAPDGSSSLGDSKFTPSQASMYSGLMAKVVQVVLGFGQQDATAGLTTHVKYAWQWDNCHGVATGPDGVAWLLWVSSVHGLLATPLPLLKNTKGLNGAEDVVRETVALFKGIPSGAVFPAALDTALSAGTALQLLTASDMADYFGKTPFSNDVGWSFNDAGSEAHNVVYGTTGFTYPPGAGTDGGHSRTQYFAYHYKLAITIGAINTSRTSGAPIAECSATFSLVESAEMRQSFFFGWLEQCCMPFFDPVSGIMRRGPSVPTTAAEVGFGGAYAGGFIGSYPVLACHIGGTLEVVRVSSDANGPDVVSERFPAPTHATSPSSTSPQFIMWGRGQRDGYIAIEAITSTVTDNGDGTTTTTASDYIWNVVTGPGDVYVETRAGVTGFAGDFDRLFSLVRGPFAETGGLFYEDKFVVPMVNVSMYGPHPHAVYTSELDQFSGFTTFGTPAPSLFPLNVKASGTLLTAALVPKPADPPDDMNVEPTYRPTPYAFSGYL